MNKILVEEADLKTLISKVDKLTSIVLSDKTNAMWLGEELAAVRLDLQPETLRKKVKSASLPIAYTRNGKGFLYNRKDIDAYLLSMSTVTGKAS